MTFHSSMLYSWSFLPPRNISQKYLVIDFYNLNPVTLETLTENTVILAKIVKMQRREVNFLKRAIFALIYLPFWLFAAYAEFNL